MIKLHKKQFNVRVYFKIIYNIIIYTFKFNNKPVYYSIIFSYFTHFFVNKNNKNYCVTIYITRHKNSAHNNNIIYYCLMVSFKLSLFFNNILSLPANKLSFIN